MGALLVLHHFPSALQQLFEFDVRERLIGSVRFACRCHFRPSTRLFVPDGASSEQSASQGRSTLDSRWFALWKSSNRMKIKDDLRRRTVVPRSQVRNQSPIGDTTSKEFGSEKSQVPEGRNRMNRGQVVAALCAGIPPISLPFMAPLPSNNQSLFFSRRLFAQVSSRRVEPRRHVVAPIPDAKPIRRRSTQV